MTGPGRHLGTNGFLRLLGKARRSPRLGYFRLDGVYIRAYANGDDACPITAVCYDQTGKYHGVAQFRSAAAALRIPRALRSAILDAADSTFEPRSRSKAALLRRRMLKVLGLTEVGA